MMKVVERIEDADQFPFLTAIYNEEMMLTLGIFKTKDRALQWGFTVRHALSTFPEPEGDEVEDILDTVVPTIPDDWALENPLH